MKHTFTFTFTLFVLALCTIFLLGCGKKLPAGMPRLFFCEITITQDNVPLAEADITLTSPDSTYSWIVGGQTDASGKALMMTNGNYEGAPEGEFIVSVSKMRLEEGKRIDPNDPYGKLTPSYEIYSVEKRYRDSATSPHKVNIESGKNQFQFDVGKAVEERVIVPNM